MWGKKKSQESSNGAKMNFAIQGFQDLQDANKLVMIANKVVESYNNDSIKRGDHMTVTFNDNRKYNVGIDPDKHLIFIQKVE